MALYENHTVYIRHTGMLLAGIYLSVIAYCTMAKIVPNNLVAFAPSMVVSSGQEHAGMTGFLRLFILI